MKIIRNILFIAFALLIQATVVGRIAIFDVRPDFALLVLILLAAYSGTVEIILYGFFIGFLQDVYNPEFLGFNAFTMSVMGFFLDVIKEHLSVENYTVRMIATLIVCLVHDVIYLLISTHFDFSIFIQMFIRQSLPGAVYTLVLAIIFIRSWEWVVNGGLFVVVQEFFGIRR